MNLVTKLLGELSRDPLMFRDSGGYDLLYQALERGEDSDAVRRVLEDASELAVHLLWLIAELPSVDSFVPEARKLLSHSDTATAAYAMEIVLRGGKSDDLRFALAHLRSCDVVVCETAVRVLAKAGIERIQVILETAEESWTRDLLVLLSFPVDGETDRSHLSVANIEALLQDRFRDRQVVGAALAVLASELDKRLISVLTNATELWIREYGEWLAGRDAEVTRILADARK